MPNKALSLTRTSVAFFYSVSLRGQFSLTVIHPDLRDDTPHKTGRGDPAVCPLQRRKRQSGRFMNRSCNTRTVRAKNRRERRRSE